MSFVIEANSLVKKYGEHTAVNGISFGVKEGQCFGLLGPNGAGKSTTFKMCYGSVEITSGDLFILKMSARAQIQKIKSMIGVVPQENGLDPDFSALDNLLIYARYYAMDKVQAKERAKELLAMMQLEDYADKPIEHMSGGMKRRLAIARALLTRPQLIFLDEPTTGLDPQARIWIWDEIKQLQNAGATVVLTTHYMEEAEALCDDILVMSRGVSVATGSPEALIEAHVGREVIEFDVQSKEVEYYISRIKDQFQYQIMRNRLKIFISESQNAREALDQIPSSNITLRKASLNDVFLKISGYELND